MNLPNITLTSTSLRIIIISKIAENLLHLHFIKNSIYEFVVLSYFIKFLLTLKVKNLYEREYGNITTHHMLKTDKMLIRAL